MEIGKIFVRSLAAIITAGVVTVLVGMSVIPEVMIAFYSALGIYVYLDKKVSKED